MPPPPVPSRKRSRVLRLVVVLALGTLITWGVAWGSALWAPAGTAFGARRGVSVDPEDLPPGWSWPTIYDRVTGNEWRSTAACFHNEFADTPAGLTVRTREFEVEDVGWPFRCMRRVLATDTGFRAVPPTPGPSLPGTPSFMVPAPPPTAVVPASSPPAVVLQRSLAAPALLSPGAACKGLPTRVLGTAYAINTVLAAAVLLVLMGLGRVAGFVVRRAVAHHRRCPECGFNPANARGPITACPGCGRAWR